MRRSGKSFFSNVARTGKRTTPPLRREWRIRPVHQPTPVQVREDLLLMAFAVHQEDVWKEEKEFEWTGETLCTFSPAVR